MALASASFGKEAICRAFDTGDFSHQAFKAYEAKVRGGVEIWYEFIRLYYKLLPMFTYFIQRDEYRADLLTLLSGDVYDKNEAPVLRKMREAAGGPPHQVPWNNHYSFSGSLDCPLTQLYFGRAD